MSRLDEYLDRLVDPAKQAYAEALAGHLSDPETECPNVPRSEWGVDVRRKVLRLSGLEDCCSPMSEDAVDHQVEPDPAPDAFRRPAATESEPSTPRSRELAVAVAEHLSRMARMREATPLLDASRHDLLLSSSDISTLQSRFVSVQTDGPLVITLTQPDPPTAQPARPSLPDGWTTEGGLTVDGVPQLTSELPLDGSSLEPEQEDLWLAMTEAHEDARAVFDRWFRDAWQPWVEDTRHRTRLRAAYDALHTHAAQQERDSEETEVVLGHGVLSLRTPSGARCQYPLVTHRATLSARPGRSVQIVVEVPVENARVEVDRFPELPDQHRQHLAHLREQLPSANDHEDVAALTQVAGHNVLRAHGTDPSEWDRDHPFSGTDGFHNGWVLFSRARMSVYRAYFSEIARILKEDPRAALPAAVQHVVSDTDRPSVPTVDARALLPLPSNDQQRTVVARLAAGEPAVAIQGPPGTGKTHTIANLVSHFLAHGKRVMVTSQKTAALRVLRDRMPADLQGLMVTAVDDTSRGKELEASVRQLLSRALPLDRDAAEATIAELERDLRSLEQEQEDLTSRLVNARELEHTPVVVGSRSMTPGEAAQWYDQHRGLAERIPDAVSGPPAVAAADFITACEVVANYEPGHTALYELGLPSRDLPTGADLIEHERERSSTRQRRDSLRTWIEDWEPSPFRAPRPELDATPEPLYVPHSGLAWEPPAAPADVPAPPRREFDEAFRCSEAADLREAADSLVGVASDHAWLRPGLRALLRDAHQAEHLEAALLAAIEDLEPHAQVVGDLLHPTRTPEAVAKSLEQLRSAAARVREGKKWPRPPRDLAALLASLRLNGFPVDLRDGPSVNLALALVERDAASARAQQSLSRAFPEIVTEPGCGAPELLRRLLVLRQANRVLVDLVAPALRYADDLDVELPALRTADHLHQAARVLAEAARDAAWTAAERRRRDRNHRAAQAHAAELLEARDRHDTAERLAEEENRRSFDRARQRWEVETEQARRDHVLARSQWEHQVATHERRERLRDVRDRELELAELDLKLAALDETTEVVLDTISGGKPGSLTARLRAAYDDRSAEDWDYALSRADELHNDTGRLDTYLRVRDALAQTAPKLLGRLLEGELAAWKPSPEEWHTAWTAASIRDELTRRTDAEAAVGLRAALTSNRERHTLKTSELVSTRAWLEAARSLSPAHQSALTEWSRSMSKIGGFKSKAASRHRAAARRAMNDCIEAVPAWVMPLDKLVETVTPGTTPFDVVIIDEASQSTLLAMATFFAGAQVVVVGDDKQVSPVVKQSEESVRDLLDDLPHDLPARSMYDFEASIYDLAGTRFGKIVQLRDHYRCRPEIITFCSNQFYEGELTAFRSMAGSRDLPPLVGHRVDGSVTERGSQRVTNEGEIAAILDFLRAADADPAYDGLTFGVVSLQGQAQAEEIEHRIASELPQLVARDIKVGDAPQFQGDERDVVCISLVASRTRDNGERRNIGAADDLDKRVNVAVSRARDQLVLFYSADAHDFRPDDPRAALIRHVENFQPQAGDLGALLAKCDSVFEEEVCTWLHGRGYRIEPQFRAGRYLIDFLASDGDTRLAIECDGDRFHTAPADRERDLARQLELEQAGFAFHRITGRAFFSDREQAYRDLEKALVARGVRPVAPAVRP